MLAKLRQLDGPMLFVIATAGLTLVTALALLPAAEPVEANTPAMLRASLLYVAVIGWQPLIAFAVVRRVVIDRRPFDVGVRPVTIRDSLFSVIVAVVVLAIAVGVDAAWGRAASHAPRIDTGASWLTVVRMIIAFVMVVAVLWLQAIIEELAWRSYVLPRLMTTLGPWPGLLAHGALWGLCYAPVFAVSGDSVARSLGFVVTCGLLGVLLGWLRLAARSIYASAASNATLTVCAGLPAFLLGDHARFSVVFEPPGWFAMLAVIAIVIAHRPWRAAIVVPWRRLPDHVN